MPSDLKQTQIWYQKLFYFISSFIKQFCIGSTNLILSIFFTSFCLFKFNNNNLTRLPFSTKVTRSKLFFNPCTDFLSSYNNASRDRTFRSREIGPFEELLLLLNIRRSLFLNLNCLFFSLTLEPYKPSKRFPPETTAAESGRSRSRATS